MKELNIPKIIVSDTHDIIAVTDSEMGDHILFRCNEATYTTEYMRYNRKNQTTEERMEELRSDSL